MFNNHMIYIQLIIVILSYNIHVNNLLILSIQYILLILYVITIYNYSMTFVLIYYNVSYILKY